MLRKLSLLLICLLCLYGCNWSSTFTLWQLPSQVNTIGNSYVIRTSHGKIIVMDGGGEQEKDYLKGFVEALGGKVDAWFISHLHNDHMGALKVLLESDSLRIDKIYHSRFTDEQLPLEGEGWQKYYETFYATLDNATDMEVIDCHSGDEFEIDGVNFKILSEKNPEILKGANNNSSMVIKMWDNHKSFIFLGDLGAAGGNKLLASEYAADLECDYLQMAHHGQAGCNKEFYQTVKFRACLWPTPSWVYNNDLGQGFNTGGLKTIEVRGWMDELGITEHYRSFEGLVKIE